MSKCLLDSLSLKRIDEVYFVANTKYQYNGFFLGKICYMIQILIAPSLAHLTFDIDTLNYIDHITINEININNSK